ncbi:hypothetical protein F4802DRAFT_597888 [Xylaria palmicola]|nr:hypothetical protein F4802DRAFT_597888 [Xylaria palmicola]
MGHAVARSAAARFASIEELLLMLAEYINDRGTLWSLCLSSWRFNCVFTPRLAELVVVRVERRDDETSVRRAVDGLLAGPYLHDLRHLQLLLSSGPCFAEKISGVIRRLLTYLPGLKIFTAKSLTGVGGMNSWESTDDDIPASVLVQLGMLCRQLEELHLRPNPQVSCHGAGFRFRDVLEQPTFDVVRVFTCRGMGIWQALSIMKRCRGLERVEMTHMGYFLALEGGYRGLQVHLRELVAREEAKRSRSGKPLRMDIWYSCGLRGDRGDRICEACNGCDEWSSRPDDARYIEVWPWASGRVRQLHHDEKVRHIAYEYPKPEPGTRGL